MIQLRKIVMIAVGAVVLSQGIAMAEMLVLNPGEGYPRHDGTLGVGYEFQVSSDTLVHSLGFWDEDGDGLAGSHYVVIVTAMGIKPSPSGESFRFFGYASP